VIITTGEFIHGKHVEKTLGLVFGNTIRARHMGRDIAAVIRGMIGGEIKDYTKMMAESREQALDRMVENAKEKGANAIIMMRFSTTSMLQGAAELLVYGTAVIVEDD
jgi:uncharacterized protein YbjQ (UPF0145 family)